MAIVRDGYGQVEPNHLSAQRTGQIYAQTPAHGNIEVLENGMFLKRNGDVLDAAGKGEWMLVYNEVKLYENHKQGYKHFALKKEEAVGGLLVPRMFKVNIGDIYTTNMVGEAVAGNVGDILEPVAVGGVGILTKVAATPVGMAFEVIKKYTMPDGQPAVKVLRIA